MHRRTTITFLAILSLLTLTAPAGARAQTSALLKGTPHDFSAAVGSTSEGCAVCHLPADPGGNKGGGGDATPYALTAFQDGIQEMGRESLLCLSCHDGVMAQSVGGYGSGGGGSHPVSTAYAESDRGFRPAEEVEAAGLHLALTDGEYRVECTSCHTSHDNSNGDFLRVPNARSALCLTCHVK
ncbi:MAG TPA: cytochrome c3 family protein [Longimicrobiales bacterium]|nr:cytochrome c3 family protein [Longimicrobiales bacterium]